MLSALLHPVRDLTLKGSPNPAYAYLFVALVWVAMAGTHAVVDGQNLALPAVVWPYAIVSAVSLSIYYYGTLASLRRGNLSVYYPIIRSSPLAIVAFNWAVSSQTYSITILVGIGLIICAGLAIQRTPGSLFDDWRALLLALMAMLASASYAIADAAAMQHASPAAFLFWVYALVSVLLGIACLAETKGSRQQSAHTEERGRVSIHRVLIASVTSYISYYLILMAFQLNADPAVVSAVRQASIPVSVILAAVLLKEPRFLQRIGWAFVLAAGIVMIVST